MKRLLFLIFLGAALPALAQDWQPLRVGYTYLHRAAVSTGPNDGENYVVADSASADSSTVYLSRAWRADSSYPSGTGGNLVHRLMRKHYLGTRCYQTGPAAWVYEVAEKNMTVEIPVSGSWQNGQTVQQPPYTLMASKWAAAGGDSILTWGLSSSESGFDFQTIRFSKLKGIQEFPFSVSDVRAHNGSGEILANANKQRSVYAVLRPGQPLPFPIHAEDWASAQPGVQMVVRRKQALWMTYSDVAFSMPVSRREVATPDSVILHGLAQTAAQPYRYDLSYNLIANGAVYTDTATMAYITVTRYMGNPQNDAFALLIRDYDNPALVPSGRQYLLPTGNYVYNFTTASYARTYTTVVSERINGESCLYEDILSEMGRTLTLAQGPGIGAETRWQVSMPADYTNTNLECYRRVGQAGSCPDIRVLVTDLPARGAEAVVRVVTNPFAETLYLQTTEPVTYQLISATGQVVAAGAVESGMSAIATWNLPAGIYQLRVACQGERVEQIRVIRQ